MKVSLQALCVVLLVTTLRHANAAGEVGEAPNPCYSGTPAELPITISYSMSTTANTTAFTFLANVRLPTVTAFGIRLNDALAAMSYRISGIPAGQLSPIGPAYIWNITHTGPQQYIFQVNTTGLTNSTGPNAAPDLADICAQGIQIADDEGHLLYQQPSPASTCISWVKQGDNCTFQTIPDNQGPSLSPRLNLPSGTPPLPVVYYASPAYSSSASPIPGGYYTYPSSPSPFSPPPVSLFGIQSSPASYSPSPVATPRAISYSPSPTAPLYSPSPVATPRAVPYSPSPVASPRAAPYSPSPGASPRGPPPSPAATLFGTSPIPYGRSPTPVPYGYSPSAYGAAPYSPVPYAPSPGSTAVPYYSPSSPGVPIPPAPVSAPSRALLSAPAATAPLFGARRLLSTIPLVNRLLPVGCTNSGQQAEPVCAKESLCSHCFERKLQDNRLDAQIYMSYDQDMNQTIYTILLSSSNSNLHQLTSLSLKVPKEAAASFELGILSQESHFQSLFELAQLSQAPDSATKPQLPRSWQRGCGQNGLQNSLRWDVITLEHGRATLLAVLPGKVDLALEDTHVINSKGKTKLLAEAGQAVLTVDNAGECYYHLVQL